jgi:type 1 glutamine amidotransferase
MIGEIPGQASRDGRLDEHRLPWGGRAFYTSFGHKGRLFEQAAFQHLLRNALMWGSGPK